MNNLISADRPIDARSQDQLERSPFARSIARAIEGWRGNESLVIGLFGPWGSGKSSLKNMVVEWLEEGETDGKRVEVIEFNPWQFANRERLTTAFFDELGIALGEGAVASRKDRRELIARLRQYAAYLQGGGSLVKALKVPLVVLLVIVAVTVFGITATEAEAIGWIAGVVILAFAGLLHWSSRVADALEKLLSASVAGYDRTVGEIKEELSDQLIGLEAPVCVFLDDVDRLTPDEVQELFQLIKVNADFPNLVYVVLCDRGTVEDHVATALDVSGRDYLEKIVQVGFDIPTVDQSQLDKVLFAGLDELLDDEEISEHFDQVRWHNLYLGGLQSYFTSLRRVKRYLSTLAFHVSLLRGDRAFEVNVVDLIGLEVLRVFEPDVYQEIARSKEALTGRPSRPRRGGTDERRRDAIRGIVELAPEERQEDVEEIVRELFPSAEWAFDGPTYAAGYRDRWYRELRVCSPEVFDRYFRLAVPEGDISQSKMAALLEAVEDRVEMRGLLEELAEQDLLDTALARLEAYKEELPLEHFESAATALFDVSGLVSPKEAGMFGTSSSMHALRIVYWYLRREPDDERRLERLRTIVRNSEGLELPVRFVALEEQAAEREERERLVDDEGLRELKEICVGKIRDAAEEGRLIESPDLLSVLHRWRDWNDEEVVRQFCEEVLDSPERALRLAGGFLQKSTSISAGDRVSRARWYVKPEVVERFVSLEQLATVLDQVPTEGLSDEEQRAVTAVQEAVDEVAEQDDSS